MKDPVEIGIEIHEQFERYPESFTIEHRTPDGKWKELEFVQFINTVRPELSSNDMSVLINLFKHFGQAAEQFGVAIGSGRQFGKSFAFQEIARIRDDYINSMCKQPETRLCDCLQCRMGKYDRCTTFSPRNSKRRGKR